uniref:Metalloendopeptidase OMA1, mitochondrial n=1 Tax=Callorhinchus milii TaxID=7868 RepID=A0A4W3KII4_CALMI
SFLFDCTFNRLPSPSALPSSHVHTSDYLVSIRNWWQGLPAHKQELLKHSVRKNKWRIVLGVCGLTGLIVTYLWLHYDTSQITGRSRLLVFSQRQLLELAAIEYESMLKTYEGTLVPETDQAYHTVQFVFNHLVEKNKDVPGMSRIKWNINVVQDAEINAFILPNGQVFVLTGLLSAVADTDQLACILAHEMAHCLLAHGAEHASFVQLLDFLSLIILTLIWAVFPRDSLALLGQWIQSKLVKYMFSRPYSRKLETEADEIGLQLAAKACVDVRTSSVYWQQLELLKIVSGTSRTPEWFSTHPSNESRVEHLNQLIPQAVKLREVCGCPALPSIDPRLVFKLSLQELLKASKKSEGTSHADSGAELPLQDSDPRAARLERMPVALPARMLQASTLSPK